MRVVVFGFMNVMFILLISINIYISFNLMPLCFFPRFLSMHVIDSAEFVGMPFVLSAKEL